MEEKRSINEQMASFVKKFARCAGTFSSRASLASLSAPRARVFRISRFALDNICTSRSALGFKFTSRCALGLWTSLQLFIELLKLKSRMSPAVFDDCEFSFVKASPALTNTFSSCVSCYALDQNSFLSKLFFVSRF